MQTTGDAATEAGNSADTFQLSAGDIKGLLQQMADRIADADRRQAEVLGQMQERLVALGQEARGVRSRVPSEFSPAFERIEEGMALLANRIAASSETVHHDSWAAPHHPRADAFQVPSRTHAEPPAVRSALKPGAVIAHHASPSAVDTFDVVGADTPSDGDSWDAASAEALARVYETSDAGLGRPAYDPDVPAAQTPPHFANAVERDWLDERLAEVAKRIESSLAGSRPDSSLAELGHRFEQFEQRFAAALDNVALRSDVDGLRLVEAHITELAQQFEQAQSQFQRLDGIERQLVGLAERLSDTHLAEIVSHGSRSVDLERLITDATERMVAAGAANSAVSAPAPAPAGPTLAELEALVRTAAEEAVERFAGHVGRNDGQQQGIGELRALIEGLVNDRRQGDETTASVLDTMQQAMIRVLDRIDAIEMNHSSPASSFGAERPGAPAAMLDPQPAHRFTSEPDFGGVAAPLVAKTKAEPEPQLREEPRIEPAPLPAPALSAFTAAAEAAPAAPAAHVAPASIDERIEPVLGPLDEQLKQDFIAAARRARRNVAGQPAIRIAQAPARAQKPTASAVPPKEAAAAAKPKAAAAALSFLNIPRKLFLGGTTAVLAVILAALLMPRANEITNGLMLSKSPGVTVSEAAHPALARSDRAAAADLASGEARGSVPETVLSDLGQSDQIDATSAGERLTSEPGGIPKGIMLQSSAETPSPEELARASRQQQMANISTELGAAAAAAASPASLQSEPTLGKPEPRAQSALDLPPASVGPLSLRLAAAKGDPSAEFEVGARLAEGKGTSQNFAEAVKWYQRSAQQGFAQAQYRLGTLFERGLGQKADLQRARIWYKRAAEQGNVKAMHNLAVLSAGRQASAPDYATAAHWFGEAASRGLTDSQFNLAVLFESGLGVPKDMKQAYKWFALSARSGDKESIKRRDSARSQLAAQELEAAEASVRDWALTPQDAMANDARTAGEAWKARATENAG
jgi:localization factor PodJL